MGLSKQSSFTEDFQNLAHFSKMLSHPARLEILKVLAERQTCVCGEIVDLLPLSQSTVSQHLKDLKLGGLVQGEIEGKHSCYCINWEALHEFHESYLDFYQELQKFKKETNCC